jgi:hypothetical protein
VGVDKARDRVQRRPVAIARSVRTREKGVHGCPFGDSDPIRSDESG